VPFIEDFGRANAAEFSPLAFTKWLDSHPGWKDSRRNAIIAVKRMFNWCVEQKLLADNPLEGVKKPRKNRRTRFLSAAEKMLLLEVIKGPYFSDYCFALLETGARPMEVARVTANDVSCDCTRWTLDEHKTDRTGEPRGRSLLSLRFLSV
jgi:integrase